MKHDSLCIALLLLAAGTFGCGGGASDASPGADGGVDSAAPGCSEIIPLLGSSCTVDQQRCEYDGDAGARCGITAVCGSVVKGEPLTWFVDDRSSLCQQNDPACPSSFTALPPGASCPAGITWNAPCGYPEGRCACIPCAPGDAGTPDGGVPTTWRCHAWGADTPGCPSIRPVPGSECAPSGLDCDYRDECLATGSGTDFECDGRWRKTETPLIRCATPACPVR